MWSVRIRSYYAQYEDCIHSGGLAELYINYKLNMNGKFCAQPHRCYFLVSHFTNKIKYWNSDIVTCNNQKCAQYNPAIIYIQESNLGFFIVGYGPAVARRTGRLPRLTGDIDREALGQRGPGQPVNSVSIRRR